jgi:hypothetical protein
MFGNPELARLNSRKAALVAQSDALRRGLLADWVQLQPVVSWMETGTSLIRRIKPFCLVLAPLLGIWAVRKQGFGSGLARKLTVGWRMWQAISAMWKGSQRD